MYPHRYQVLLPFVCFVAGISNKPIMKKIRIYVLKNICYHLTGVAFFGGSGAASSAGGASAGGASPSTGAAAGSSAISFKLN